ncbi:hypothetical protein HMPREF2664_10620 [Staphylococcus sp. HMSC064E03]|uniref:hypothetical protein n=1 Tax=unclassified Staphylococcus TaxID=91994 RepID=UPI0008A1D564|nr:MULTISPECIES: hypothetical protein [unclassified Staphylococcus]OFS52756.1 hypothetical protein HMPREF2862_10790 [Staphylococcus sp. HMSC065C09]OHQ09647.1 hypothetical protein HMPREF2664_10620 [Staphylococcus sp. HMSC064E03]
MNYKEIKKLLENQEHKEVVKGIFGFELQIDDNEKLEEIYQFYYKNPMPNFLDYEICEVAQHIDNRY